MMSMQDVYEIQKLMYEYCWLVDSGDFDGVVDLLKDADVAYEGRVAYRHDPVGYAKTTKGMFTYEDGTTKTIHMCIDPIIEVAEDGLTATGKSYTVVLQGITGEFPPQIIWMDRKFDTFEKVDGKWRFASRNFVTRAEGDVSHHLKNYKRR